MDRRKSVIGEPNISPGLEEHTKAGLVVFLRGPVGGACWAGQAQGDTRVQVTLTCKSISRKTSRMKL